MIYDFPDVNVPIRQGDIFFGLPRFDISLNSIPIVYPDENTVETSWEDIAEKGEAVTAIVSARPTKAIVISQDCDSLRSPDITLCEIREFQDIERSSKDTKKASSWISIITQHSKLNQKWFYLPPDSRIGFESKMGVDFMLTICLPRIDIESLRRFRRGRLNDYAEIHFRERIAEFFRRYPLDEWYSLNDEELSEYVKNYPDTRPYPWQGKHQK